MSVFLAGHSYHRESPALTASSKSYCLPKAPSPNIKLLGVKASIYESGEGWVGGGGLKHSVHSIVLVTNPIYSYMNIFKREPMIEVSKHRNIFSD